ncbi:unnamed protein product [Caenorhabditis angaria]|uniref:Uncharacterized protein n=1 Tax=Caenorhabditis angaria TaxID=860376 RepID=A0A9P1N0X5_9PELO|nr:unnamed protein product [Caenorhabditis angaria]
MGDEEDDIVWIRDDPIPPQTPTTPATIIEVLSPTPTVTISAPPEQKLDENINEINRSTSKPPDTPTENSASFDISEYEKNLNKTTREANALLEELDRKSRQVAENNQQVAKDLYEARDLLNSGNQEKEKTINDVSQLPPPPELPSGGLPSNVESVLIGDGILENITGTLVLPNGLVLVTDENAGIILFDLSGNIQRKINAADNEFKRLWSPVYHKEHILILADAKNSENHWVRHVIKYTVDLNYVAKIECPKWLSDSQILRERLSIAHNDHLYLCVCGETFSGLYELTPIGQWTELEYKLSEAWCDMLAFSTIGPITQLLVVEARKNYVLLVSVRESKIVGKKRIAICEHPGALAKDEAGRLFVANRHSASIQLVDTIKWVSQKNIAITDGYVRHFTACWGLLAVPLKNAIRLQKYSFRSLR